MSEENKQTKNKTKKKKIGFLNMSEEDKQRKEYQKNRYQHMSEKYKQKHR